jgi:homoserine dehydrogenase
MRIAVLGVGTVGRAVLELLAETDHTAVAVADSDSAAVDEADAGLDLDRVLSQKEYRDRVGDREPAEVLDAEYDVLIEATPTTLGDAQPGFSHVERALARDRHVVLANKGPVAQRYGDLRALEAESEGRVLFEATVGGTIPVLSTIQDFDGQITTVRGVLNGTTNFILSRMATEGLGYEHILAEAQDLGVAEADPSFDVQGTDTALKCVILANRLHEATTTLEDAEVEGIIDLPGEALDLARRGGQTVRLVGEVTADGAVSVGPRLVSEHGTLAVSGTANVVELQTERAGPLTLGGRGGGPETASAVLADLERIRRETR